MVEEENTKVMLERMPDKNSAAKNLCNLMLHHFEIGAIGNICRADAAHWSPVIDNLLGWFYKFIIDAFSEVVDKRDAGQDAVLSSIPDTDHFTVNSDHLSQPIKVQYI